MGWPWRGFSASAPPLTQCRVNGMETEASGEHMPIIRVDSIELCGLGDDQVQRVERPSEDRLVEPREGCLRLAQHGFGSTGEPPQPGVKIVGELPLQGPQDSQLDGPPRSLR